MAEEAIESDLEASAPRITCDQCGRRSREGRSFAFNRGPETPGQITKCVYCALRHSPMLRRSFKVALVVGTALTLLNQGDSLFAGNWANSLYWKIPLTYCVPFCVATYGALSNGRR